MGKTIQLEAGTQGMDRVWIGAPVECYDTVKKPLTERELHVLHFSVPQAEAVISMLKAEVRRLKRKASPND